MLDRFAIEESAHGRASVLRVAGRLDARNAQTLSERCQAALQGGRAHVVLNLAAVPFIASSGIGTLLALTETFQEAGGGLRIAAPSDGVRSVVDLLNIGQFLNMDATEEAGLAAVRG